MADGAGLSPAWDDSERATGLPKTVENS